MGTSHADEYLVEKAAPASKPASTARFQLDRFNAAVQAHTQLNMNNVTPRSVPAVWPCASKFGSKRTRTMRPAPPVHRKEARESKDDARQEQRQSHLRQACHDQLRRVIDIGLPQQFIGETVDVAFAHVCIGKNDIVFAATTAARGRHWSTADSARGSGAHRRRADNHSHK